MQSILFSLKKSTYFLTDPTKEFFKAVISSVAIKATKTVIKSY